MSSTVKRAKLLPEKRLDAQEIAWVTGLHKLTVLKLMKDPACPLAKGVACLGGKFSTPLSSYNTWVEEGLLVKPAKSTRESEE